MNRSPIPQSLQPPVPADTVVPETPQMPADDGLERILRLDPRLIERNPRQPRLVFNEEALEELAESIRMDGVQEPIIVRKVGEKYEIVSGERRVRASIMSDQETVPAICRDISDSELLRLALIENIQREDLNPIETARSYQELMNEFNWTQEMLSQQVGKKRATVANTLRLLNLPAEVQEHLMAERLTMGHAKVLLSLDSPDEQSAKARAIIREGLSVRDTERMTAKPDAKAKKLPAPPAPKDPNVVALEDELRRALGTKVALHVGKDKQGKIEIEFYGYDDLDRILDILRKK
jgi:ParB family chromosome partitioning protein